MRHRTTAERSVCHYTYRQDVLAGLSQAGIRPGPTTRPELAREQLNDLYRYEIRRLRGRLRQGEIRRADYAAHVMALRRRYPLLSRPLREWTEPDGE